MKFRHAAALALVGWYLLLCDPTTAELMPSIGCHIQTSFDTAKECEEARAILAEKQKAGAASMTKPAGGPVEKALCFATDDARLRARRQIRTASLSNGRHWLAK